MRDAQAVAGGDARVDVPLPLLECVPNVSEGRDHAVIEALAAVIRNEGAILLDIHSDVDHHRSVFTFLGAPDDVERAALALALGAVGQIDLRRHRGVHPRIGAIDVIPFVPLRTTTMRDAVAAAHRMGLRFAEQADVPVFFYGEAAATPDRRELPLIRRGGFERLSERLCAPGWRPDAGPAAAHPTAGASVIGARWPLVAFNALLDTGELPIARAIASTIRESSGGLPAVRAMGVVLRSRGRAQVSMNLVDYRRTPPAVVAAAIETEALRRGTRVREYELVGCAPASLFAPWPVALAPVAGLKPSQLLDPALLPP